MSKFSVGDMVRFTSNLSEHYIVGKIIGWRGGSVAPYIVEIIESDYSLYKTGEKAYRSGRDMELKRKGTMGGKKKVYCCHQTCNTYSFEDKGTIKWECFKHYPNNFNNTGCIKESEMNTHLSTEDKLNLLLDYLGLEIETEPKVKEVKKANPKKKS